MDITLTEGEEGKALAHRPDCPMVREHRRQGRILATMFGVEELPGDLPLHECLTEEGESDG